MDITELAKEDGRRQRSRRTRKRIVDAASALFVDRGYVMTTIESVAERAGVAVQTVYYVFGTKPHLLAAVIDASVAGATEAPVVEQPWVGELESAPDASSAVTQMVDACVAILARVAPVYAVVRRAAADGDVGALLDDNRARRRSDQRRLVEIVERAGHLRAGMDVDTAADTFYALVNEEVFLLLTVDCGWPLERFRQWTTALVLDQLINQSPRADPADR